MVAGVDGADCPAEALTMAVEEAAGSEPNVEVVAVYRVVDWGIHLYRADRYRSDLPSPDDIRGRREVGTAADRRGHPRIDQRRARDRHLRQSLHSDQEPSTAPQPTCWSNDPALRLC